MKSYTDLEQSKKLAEILPLESADMHYDKDSLENYYCPIPLIGKYSEMHNQVPAWSLAALLNMLQDNIKIEKTLFDQSNMFTYSILGDGYEYRTNEHKNLIDTCYEMILNLNELNLL